MNNKKVVNGSYYESEEEPTLTPSLPLKLHLSPGHKAACKTTDQEARNPVSELVASEGQSFFDKSVEKQARYWDLKTAAAYIGISVNALRKRIQRESMDVIQRAPGCRIELTQELIDEHKRRCTVRKLRRSVNSSVLRKR